MFLTKNNQVKWKKIGVGAIVTLGLVVLGVMWYDRPLYLFMREFDCGFWGWLDRFFSFKMWLMGSAVVLGAFWIKKVLKTKGTSNYFQNLYHLSVDIYKFLSFNFISYIKLKLFILYQKYKLFYIFKQLIWFYASYNKPQF